MFAIFAINPISSEYKITNWIEFPTEKNTTYLSNSFEKKYVSEHVLHIFPTNLKFGIPQWWLQEQGLISNGHMYIMKDKTKI